MSESGPERAAKRDHAEPSLTPDGPSTIESVGSEAVAEHDHAEPPLDADGHDVSEPAGRPTDPAPGRDPAAPGQPVTAPVEQTTAEQGESAIADRPDPATNAQEAQTTAEQAVPTAAARGVSPAAVPTDPAAAVLPAVDYSVDATVVAVVVTHKRHDLLAESLKAVAAQSRPVDHLIVVDNGNEDEVAELVADQPVPTTYLGSAHNLGGAGGFALGMLHALSLGADWVWLADDDGRPDGPEVLATLFDCARRHELVEVSPVVCDIDEPDRLAFPLRRGLVWRRRRSELGDDDFLPGIASLFNGALISAQAVDVIGVPDLRLFVRGDEVEVHRRLVRSGLPFGTCLQTAYLHPNGAAEFKPILGGRMHTQYPDDPVKRYFTYRNRGYLMSQPGMRKLLPQEWIRFSWFFLVTRRDPAGLREWFHLRSLGRNEQFQKPD